MHTWKLYKQKSLEYLQGFTSKFGTFKSTEILIGLLEFKFKLIGIFYFIRLFPYRVLCKALVFTVYCIIYKYQMILSYHAKEQMKTFMVIDQTTKIMIHKMWIYHSNIVCVKSLPQI